MTTTVLFAGGGTGGHLFPALAVAERLDERVAARFACSDRPIDARILGNAAVRFHALSVRPLPRRPWHVPPFVYQYVRSMGQAGRLIEQHDVRVVVSMGGFVSAPVVEAAARRKVPTLLVNLDAVPGVANRYLVRRCVHVFSVHESKKLPAHTQAIAMPLRRASLADRDPAACRAALGLSPDRPVLLVTGASQGAASINRLMVELIGRPAFRDLAAGCSVLHLAGYDRDEAMREAYAAAGVRAQVLAFTHEMGLAWGAADLAISRAGANSVAEAAANAVPTIFLPYPYHADQHQKHNAAGLARSGGAMIVEDAVDPVTNADRVQPLLTELVREHARREAMRAALRSIHSGDGAEELAAALRNLVDL